ncbi:RcnB family protein [Sphingomonas sp.]|jgi:Ni/Co efflux regulator RcnB|uniref:RcnB family protein n=1 Tax=Sphingomonas sp. TaxID=28214 RepID=UPI002E35123C|nr:RcnB family protein [Sphingomonas sp.]HEX4693081.1 RcnB family protein [Sphingomonas sp.]
MRTLVIAAIATAMSVAATPAEAQRIGPQGQPPVARPMPPRANPRPMPNMPRPANGQWQRNGQWQGGQRQGGQWQGGAQWQGGGQWRGNNGGQRNGRSRWGNRIGGFWWAGVQAPGGWNGYSRMKRGKRLPGYWISPNYIISDWQLYGLGMPPEGYYWSRYYNDAVLIDANGMVYDSIGSVDWDRYQGGYAYDDEYQGGDYAYGGDAGPGYPPAAYPAPQGPGPGYGAPYPAPGGYDGSSTTTRSYTYSTGGGYAGGPPPMAGPPMAGPPRIAYGNTYYTSPGSVTTIVIPGSVTTTTTTTEYVEERYVAPRRVVRVVRRWHPRPKPRCSCKAPRPILGS